MPLARLLKLSPLCRISVVALMLVCAGISHAQEINLAFADDSPPLTYAKNGQALGIIPELAQWLIEHTPGLSFKATALAWPRAQREVEQGRLDGFLTYPSGERQNYAVFTPSAVYHINSSYLIYRHDNPHRARMERATQLSDLNGLTLVAPSGTGFVDDNIPAGIQRVFTPHVESVYHLLFKRRNGDFTLLPPEQAIYSTKQLGYHGALRYHAVDFIPNSKIPLHLGISKANPKAQALIALLESTLQTTAFKQAHARIVKSYRTP
ncbi:substrate-binding periplasmic protein [Atopomonas sediminilitoris]|uniref:substrate-binding periplasmic protein n=1 Tax=Atopomonas sediminilitoris TaxID=2919919 RepID=UPI001F4DC1FF|nr:hypothetical protein [Atopomonas sediminilitoris]MCJ8169597.1 hypothetical protein [Atopomonas sediminilitoris]